MKIILFIKDGDEYVFVHRDKLKPGQTVESFIRRITEAGLITPPAQIAIVLSEVRIQFAYVKPTSVFTVNMAPYELP